MRNWTDGMAREVAMRLLIQPDMFSAKDFLRRQGGTHDDLLRVAELYGMDVQANDSDSEITSLVLNALYLDVGLYLNPKIHALAYEAFRGYNEGALSSSYLAMIAENVDKLYLYDDVDYYLRMFNLDTPECRRVCDFLRKNHGYEVYGALDSLELLDMLASYKSDEEANRYERDGVLYTVHREALPKSDTLSYQDMLKVFKELICCSSVAEMVQLMRDYGFGRAECLKFKGLCDSPKLFRSEDWEDQTEWNATQVSATIRDLAKSLYRGLYDGGFEYMSQSMVKLVHEFLATKGGSLSASAVNLIADVIYRTNDFELLNLYLSILTLNDIEWRKIAAIVDANYVAKHGLIANGTDLVRGAWKSITQAEGRELAWRDEDGVDLTQNESLLEKLNTF